MTALCKTNLRLTRTIRAHAVLGLRVVYSHQAPRPVPSICSRVAVLSKCPMCSKQRFFDARIYILSRRRKKGAALRCPQTIGSLGCHGKVDSIVFHDSVSHAATSLIRSGFCVIIHAGLASRHSFPRTAACSAVADCAALPRSLRVHSQAHVVRFDRNDKPDLTLKPESIRSLAFSKVHSGVISRSG